MVTQLSNTEGKFQLVFSTPRTSFSQTHHYSDVINLGRSSERKFGLQFIREKQLGEKKTIGDSKRATPSLIKSVKK